MTTYEENTKYINQSFKHPLKLNILFIDKVQCDICQKFYHCTSIRRHIRNQHGSVSQAKCEVCNMTFKNDGVKKDHMRRKHNVYQSSGFF